MTLGPNFLSPFGDSPAATGGGPDDDLFREIFAAIDALDGAPITLWIARSVVLTRSPGLPIPSNVILTFAPGAVLTLKAGVIFEHQGRIDLGLERRFNLDEGARVLLTGPLDEIHASWWSGRGSSGADSASRGSAITHALNVLWLRYEKGLPPAPILLSGQYFLRETIKIDPTEAMALTFPGQTFDVMLRGCHYGVGSPMTLAVDDSDSVDDPAPVGELFALLAVNGKVALTLENLGFDTTRRYARSPAQTALRLIGRHHRVRVVGCSFKVGLSKGIYVTEQVDGVEAVLLDVVIGSSDPDIRLTIARCDFEGSAPGHVVMDAVPIYVSKTGPIMVSVSDCQFRGAYDRAIVFHGSELMVTNCAFDNSVLAPADDLQGVDIDLNSRRVAADELAGGAQITVTHCVSTSPTFLSARASIRADDRGGAVLTNVVHQPRVGVRSEPCSVRWAGPYQSRSLVLQGCELGAPVRLVDAGRTQGLVIEIGCEIEGAPGTRARYPGAAAGAVVYFPDRGVLQGQDTFRGP